MKRAIAAAAEQGCARMFFVLLPEDNCQKRADSFAVWRETFPAIAAFAEEKGVRLALEGWPGPSPGTGSGCRSPPERRTRQFARQTR